MITGLLLFLHVVSLQQGGRAAAAQGYQELKIKSARLFLKAQNWNRHIITCPTFFFSEIESQIRPDSRVGDHTRLYRQEACFTGGHQSNKLPDKKGSRGTTVCEGGRGGMLQFLILCCPFFRDDWRANSGEQGNLKLPVQN